MDIFQKQPTDQLDYDLDFSEWLPDTDVITGVEAEASSPDLDIIAASIHGTTAKIFIGGGLDNTTYKVTATIATKEGRIKEHDFKIRVRNT